MQLNLFQRKVLFEAKKSGYQMLTDELPCPCYMIFTSLGTCSAKTCENYQKERVFKHLRHLNLYERDLPS